MKKGKHLSLLALTIVLVFFMVVRLVYATNNDKNGYNLTTWDAFGYYLYLPSIFIYEDVSQLNWVPQIDSTYQVTGGQLYQAMPLESGGYTNKYFSGVALMELPFFAIGHSIAKLSSYPADGFSKPYQYSLMWGIFLYTFIGLWVLRKVLLHYFSDVTTAYTLLFLGLTSNWVQYVSIDGAMSHAYIFPLYAMVLWQTIKWYQNFLWKDAFLIGLLIGLATLCRPTELIMLFIPLLWRHDTADSETKFQLLKRYKWQVILCGVGIGLALLPQLIYWKITTGHFIHNVGSKWYFFNPWFRVLVGPEKGWFLYTPVALFMIIGLFLLGKHPGKKSLLTFCILNIWIIIAWSDWRYGASYSTRALTQSYPVFALALAAFWSRPFWQNKHLWIGVLLLGLTALNIYQLGIYNSGIIENFSPFLP